MKHECYVTTIGDKLYICYSNKYISIVDEDYIMVWSGKQNKYIIGRYYNIDQRFCTIKISNSERYTISNNNINKVICTNDISLNLPLISDKFIKFYNNPKSEISDALYLEIKDNKAIISQEITYTKEKIIS